MSITDPFSSPKALVDRDRYGRPLIVPPEGGKPIGYTRVTTFAGSPEDGWVLNQWEKHQLMLALAPRPDLILSALAHKDNWGRLCEIVDEAMSTSEGPTRATQGTALHLLCDQWDEGTLDLESVPQPWRADVEKYAELTQGWTWVHHEVFRVWDRYRVAGTADRIGYDPKDGELKVADLKFGRVDSSPQKVAIQVTCYAYGEDYNLETGERDGHCQPSLEEAVVIHIPQGENEAEFFGKPRAKSKALGFAGLHPVKLKTGLAGCQVAEIVREWRRKQDIWA